MNKKSMRKYSPIFLLPMLIAFTIGFIVPFILGVYLSFCEFTTVTDAKFVGLKNYIRFWIRRMCSCIPCGIPRCLRSCPQC